MTDVFPELNRGFNHVFRPNQLSLGVVVPIENYPNHPVPTMERHVERVQLAESLGFGAVWLRDVPFNVPSFGDAGQTYDPFVYLGFLAAVTSEIALGVASVILPLRHPLHIAKAAVSTNALSKGRLILGVASGDRPQEYPATHTDYDSRGALFRESYDYMRRVVQEFPSFENGFGTLQGNMDLLPKTDHVPMLITGGSQQTPDWIAQNGDGWMTYPRQTSAMQQVVSDYRSRLRTFEQPHKPVLQPLYIDLVDEDDFGPQPIHLGLRIGVNPLLSFLKHLEEIGVNHVALNLRFNQNDIEETLKRISNEIIPHFHETKTS